MKKHIGIVLFIILSIFILSIYIFSILIKSDYASFYVSDSISESQEIGAFKCKYNISDSNDNLEIKEAVENIWAENMWGYFNKYYFWNELKLSESTFLVIRHPENYIQKTFDNEFKEVFFFKKNELHNYNFSQQEQIISLDTLYESIILEVFLKSCNNEEPIYVGDVILNKSRVVRSQKEE
jgi:hypothetical protein